MRTRVVLMIVIIISLMMGCTPTITTKEDKVIKVEDTAKPHKDNKEKAEIRDNDDEESYLDQVLNEEAYNCFRFFFEQVNTDEASGGYGLIRDRYPGNPNLSSIASVGFGLTAILIGIENNWIPYEEGYTRVLKTLETFETLDHFHGFYYHFLNINTGEKASGSEISTIDTAIFINGALFAGEYFGGEIKEKAEELYKRIEWNKFVDENRKMFYMSYRPEKGFEGHWDFYAEQLMLYVLGAGSPTDPIDPELYYSFIRKEDKYREEKPFIHSWFNSLFTYQYSHGWIDFRNTKDREGVNWFDNSITASKVHYLYTRNNSERYKTFTTDAWGVTACDGPTGYNGLYGVIPSGYDNKAHYTDGTVAPYGAIASLVFTEEESKKAVKYYGELEKLSGEYGFTSGFNLDFNGQEWYASDVIGIDKGITLIMIQNYQDEFVWRTFMENQFVKEGMERLKIIRGEN